MKQYLVPLLIPIVMLVGCNKQKETTTTYNEPHYEEVEELHIEWKDIFNQENSAYYAYIYSVTCTPCSMLREEVINFAKGNNVNFYFVYPSDDIAFTDDSNLADASLGATSIENVYCYNTPTLIGITNKTITSYSRDYYEIKSFIESHMN